ncbi:hypothetical protein OK016_22450 [Vibrio chagasii]|nr:hypothetical protein [Vibrio chagasii]
MSVATWWAVIVWFVFSYFRRRLIVVAGTAAKWRACRHLYIWCSMPPCSVVVPFCSGFFKYQEMFGNGYSYMPSHTAKYQQIIYRSLAACFYQIISYDLLASMPESFTKN